MSVPHVRYVIAVPLAKLDAVCLSITGVARSPINSGRSGKTVVLQKLVEDRKLLEKGSCLCNYSKDLVDEEDPFSDGSFLHIFNLSFPHHVHNFVSL